MQEENEASVQRPDEECTSQVHEKHHMSASGMRVPASGCVWDVRGPWCLRAAHQVTRTPGSGPLQGSGQGRRPGESLSLSSARRTQTCPKRGPRAGAGPSGRPCHPCIHVHNHRPTSVPDLRSNYQVVHRIYPHHANHCGALPTHICGEFSYVCKATNRPSVWRPQTAEDTLWSTKYGFKNSG